MKITKTKVKGKLPTTTEGLRQKLRLEGNTWLVIASECRHKHYLQGLEAKDWEEFTEYLLGDKVLNIEVTRADGSKMPLDPPSPVRLSYEHALRKEAFRRAVEEECQVAPRTFKRALKEVVRDSEIKDLYFTSSLTLSTKRPHDQASGSHAQSGAGSSPKVQRHDQQVGRGKGRGKGGRGKGRGAAGAEPAPNETPIQNGKHTLLRQTPDGKMICFQFNNNSCKSKKCKFLHICRIKGCGLERPMIKHDGW